MGMFYGGGYTGPYFKRVNQSIARHDHMAAANAKLRHRKTRSTASRVQALEARLERALLTSEALWSLLSEKMGLTQEELIQRINDIDLTDGELDGKMRKEPVSCPSCKEDISPWVAHCPHCKQAILFDPFA